MMSEREKIRAEIAARALAALISAHALEPNERPDAAVRYADSLMRSLEKPPAAT